MFAADLDPARTELDRRGERPLQRGPAAAEEVVPVENADFKALNGSETRSTKRQCIV